MLKKLSSLFRQISSAVSGRNRPQPNPKQAVDDFRAAKRAKCYSDELISSMLVASRISTEAALIAQNRSDSDIDAMNWSYLLQNSMTPPPPSPFVYYPRDWRAQQAALYRKGYGANLTHEILEVRGERERRAANPLLSLFAPLPRVEPRGSIAESCARLREKGYTPREIIAIITARVKALPFERYANLEEEARPIAEMNLQERKAARPPLRLTAAHDTRAP